MSSSDRRHRARQMGHGAGGSSRSPASLGTDAHSSRNSQVRRLEVSGSGWPQNPRSASCAWAGPPYYAERKTSPGLESCPRRRLDERSLTRCQVPGLESCPRRCLFTCPGREMVVAEGCPQRGSCARSNASLTHDPGTACQGTPRDRCRLAELIYPGRRRNRSSPVV